VHPEAYPVVERILARIGGGIQGLMGQQAVLKALPAADFADERFGIPTVRDILAELEKPGRDPRPEFKMAAFQEGVEKLSDLQPEMILEGVVTNVAAFGAFVDIGVHQDGLVHISVLSNRFVKDPHEVVKPGQIVKVKVIEVDLKRQRVALSMRLDDAAGARAPQRQTGGANANAGARDRRNAKEGTQRRPPGGRGAERDSGRETAGPSAMALAFAKLKAAK
jgi:uncharacterized protein